VIIVAVKKFGRVRIPKARVDNKAFSIGRKWNMGDFSAILSFSNLEPQKKKKCNGNSWPATLALSLQLANHNIGPRTSLQRKEHFIASLVMMYGKYTGGKATGLSRFTPSPSRVGDGDHRF